jgi:hypothetical protein
VPSPLNRNNMNSLSPIKRSAPQTSIQARSACQGHSATCGSVRAMSVLTDSRHLSGVFNCMAACLWVHAARVMVAISGDDQGIDHLAQLHFHSGHRLRYNFASLFDRSSKGEVREPGHTSVISRPSAWLCVACFSCVSTRQNQPRNNILYDVDVCVVK